MIAIPNCGVQLFFRKEIKEVRWFTFVMAYGNLVTMGWFKYKSTKYDQRWRTGWFCRFEPCSVTVRNWLELTEIRIS